MAIRGVIFDLGGVVLGSPLVAIQDFERENHLTDGLINRVVSQSGKQGAWSRLERGELDLERFYSAFEQDALGFGAKLNARAMMTAIEAAAKPRAAMLAAIAKLRQRSLITTALTNNWVSEEIGWSRLKPHFDHFIESAKVGLRKPDPRIYHLTCETMQLTPAEIVFLDDIGANLKPARALGMTTIKVSNPDDALEELGHHLGFPIHTATRPLGVIEAITAAQLQCPSGNVGSVAKHALEVIQKNGSSALPEQAFLVLCATRGWQGERAQAVKESLEEYLASIDTQ